MKQKKDDAERRLTSPDIAMIGADGRYHFL
jgi:hypothetical protein